MVDFGNNEYICQLNHYTEEMTENTTPFDKANLATVMETLKNYSVDYSHLGEDYIISRISAVKPQFKRKLMGRFNGMTVLVSVRGTLHLTLNMESVVVKPNSAVFIAPETFLRPEKVDEEELEFFMLFLSNRFMHGINFDMNAVNTSLLASNDPVLELTPERTEVLRRYFDLLHLTSLEDNNYSRHIARSLAEAAGYQLMAYGEEAVRRMSEEQPRTRRATYVRTFLGLVRDNHRREHSIGFYADRMFISPKYLSLIIKEATGKSAAEWIDQYVIQEAKNLLRYSGKNVQQIAYELNFTNQSSFGKYFKHITGLSPTQFQNS